jgi:hypothetical protein
MSRPTRHATKADVAQENSIALKAAVATALHHLGEAQKALAPHLHGLSASARKRVVKMRTGGDRHVVQLASLAESRPALVVGTVSPARMLTDLDDASALGTLDHALGALRKTVEDTSLVALGDAWSQALDVYAVGQRLADSDATVAAVIGAFADFLKHAPEAHEAAPGAPATPAK